ncbi:MAG: MBL fold metallo-hydrolase [Candidatus Helarchaeales archaeon]
MPDRIILLGTGTAIANAHRFPSSVLLILNNTPFLIDCGPGIQRRLSQVSEFSINDLDYLFITHTHADHVSDIVILLKEFLMQKRSRSIHLFGPSGLKSFIESLFQHSYSYLEKALDLVSVNECSNGKILSNDNVDVSVAPTVHGINSIAFRIESRLHSIVISGDTSFSPELAKLATNCEYLIHECSYPDDHDTRGHSTPRDIIKILKEARPKNLILTHFYPETEERLQEIKNLILHEFPVNVIIGHDLLEIEL